MTLRGAICPLAVRGVLEADFHKPWDRPSLHDLCNSPLARRAVPPRRCAKNILAALHPHPDEEPPGVCRRRLSGSPSAGVEESSLVAGDPFARHPKRTRAEARVRRWWGRKNLLGKEY